MAREVSEEVRQRQRDACRRWREAHPERQKASQDKYRAAHLEERAEQTRAWREANPGASAKACQNWRKNNVEASNEAVRRWDKANPEKVAEYQRNRRDRKNALGEKWRGLSVIHAKMVKVQFEHKCFKCAGTHRLALDHNMPLSAGFPLELGNAVLLCNSCNSSKRDKFPEDFYSFSELQALKPLLEAQKQFPTKTLKS